MSTLIRAAKCGKQPKILARVKPAILAPHSNARMVDKPDATTAVSTAAPVMSTPTATYEDHERRLGEKLAHMQQEASKRGYAEGLQAAQDKVQAEYAAEIEALRALIVSAQSALNQQLDGVMDAAAEIVYAAVVKILGRAYADQAGVVAVVREVVNHAKERNHLVIRVHPGDLEVVRACAADIAQGACAGNIEIAPDDRVVLGGCLLETPAGTLDGRLEIQLQQLRDTLVHARLRHADGTIGS